MSLKFFIRSRGNSLQVVFRHQGKQITRAIKADSIKSAERLAPLLIEAYVAEHYRGIINPLRPSASARPAKSATTIADLIDAYSKANKRCNGSVEASNRQAFLRVARGLTGLDNAGTGKKGLDIFTPRSVMAWQAAKQGLDAPVPDLNSRRDGNRTINSCLAAAACVLSPSSQYPFAIPQEMRDAFAVTPLPVPRQGWQPWPLENYKRMAEAGDELTGDLWLCHQLLRRFGLRASEAKAAHASWIRPMSGDRIGLAIQDYPGQIPHPFSIKGAQARVLPIPADLVRAIQYRAAKGGYLLDGYRKYLVTRGKIEIDMPLVDSEHVAFLREYAPEGIQKPNHELRKWVGAIIYSSKGAEAARAFLGHSDLAVLLQHYSSYLASVDVDDLLRTIE